MKPLLAILLVFVCALPVQSQPATDFTAIVRSNFSRWDLNHDGILSPEEISAAMTDPGTTNQNAAAVVALKRILRSSKNPPPPLTLAAITQLAAQDRPNLVSMFHEDLDRIASATNRALFADGLPSLQTIHQGEMGNCFCLAPLGAMVHRDPAQVAAMFSQSTNGLYSVRLGRRTVVVAPPTDAELALSSANERHGIWVNVYEKAVGAARNEDQPAGQRATSPLDALARGGSAGTMLAYITGHDMERFSFKFAKDAALPAADYQAKLVDLRQRLQLATDRKQLMTCGTLKVTTPGLTPNHAYAVLGYHAGPDSVELWNPHGQDFCPEGAPGSKTGYQTSNGIFQIPVGQFVIQFSGMAFEVPETKIPQT